MGLKQYKQHNDASWDEFERHNCKHSKTLEDESTLIREVCACVFWVNLSLNDLFNYPSIQAIHYRLVKTYLILEM